MNTFLSIIFAVAGVARTHTAPHALGEVFFPFDSDALPLNATDRLDASVAYARANPTSRLVLDAHCDPIGTGPYNVALAIRRAEAVRGTLTEMGVPADQIVVATYGKDGARRATYAEDRRVSVRATHASLASVIAQTFAGDGTAVTWERPMTSAQIAAAPDAVADVEHRR